MYDVIHKRKSLGSGALTYPNSELTPGFWLGFVLTGVLYAFGSVASLEFLQILFVRDSLFVFLQFVPFISCGIVGGISFCRLNSMSPRRCWWRPLLLMLAIFAISQVIIFTFSDNMDILKIAYHTHVLLFVLWVYLNGAIGAGLLTAFVFRVHDVSVDAFSPPTIP